MNIKIVADSSANLLALRGVDFASVPLKIITADREYVDDSALDVNAMVADLAAYKGRSSSSCPNVQDWLDAFAGADLVFALTITRELSGSYACALSAKAEYEAAHPGARVYVVNSLSAGPELQLLAERLRALALQGLPPGEIWSALGQYGRHTHLLFSLESMKNLARNGRTSPAVAALAGVLGVRVVGQASEAGTLELLHKCRGPKRALQAVYNCMLERGYAGGRVRIAQCQNPGGAKALAVMLLRAFPKADVKIVPCRGLCAFYAEAGGLMIGYEDGGAQLC